MQDAFGRDMFNVPNINCSRYNGHTNSTTPKSVGGRRDRKGCTKGKIEAIMKNNSVRPKTFIPISTPKKVYTPPVPKLDTSEEDPYTFNESEPQALSQYQASCPWSSAKQKTAARPQSSISTPVTPTTSTMVCADKARPEPPKPPVKPTKAEGNAKMNKLQADIARNKVIGKRKKVEQLPNSAHINDWAGSASRKDGKLYIMSRFSPRKSSWQKECKSRHELLERIQQAQTEVQKLTKDIYPLGLEASDSDDDLENSQAVYERHWFSRSQLSEGRRSSSTRESRVEETKTELRRKLTQTLRGLSRADVPSSDLVSAVIRAARRFPNATAVLLDPSLIKTSHKANRGARFLIAGEKCSYSEGCNWQSLPCTRHCLQHIMYNVDQRLFSHCTAKYADNTQCTVPVFDVLHEFPLCPLHASEVGRVTSFGRKPPEPPLQKPVYEQRQGKKVPKKGRVTLGVGSRNNKRSQKKRKKPSMSPPPPPLLLPPNTRIDDDLVKLVETDPHLTSDVPTHLIESALAHDHNPQFDGVMSLNCTDGDVVEVSEEVLAIESLDPAELASQASRLLEEHDITNMLNTIPPDAFNDIFIDKNGHYGPTRGETEELERQLEEVDKEVERLSRSLPLLHCPLDISFLDGVGSTGSFPSFQNGFPPPTPTDIHPS